MCGILGLLGQCEAEKFKLALNTLNHRGPDDFGIWRDNNVSFGHRRLSIIDLSLNAKQPMHWGDRYVIVFNGEIYNYIELRQELEKKGVRFQTKSDTEVLVALYAHEGAACLNKLNGMWAFAIYDRHNQSLFLARDRMGKKPLFFARVENQFVFASEMKAICHFLKKIEPNIELINKARNNFFCYESTDECLIKGISRFPAASYGILKNNNFSIYKYWNLENSLIKVPSNYNEQVEMFRELFLDACKIRMRSDVTIGTALSGGIDSSATISSMSYIGKSNDEFCNKDWQHAYVASFPGSTIDEKQEAKKVVDYLGISATYLEIDPLKEIDKIFYYSYLFEELYLTSPIPFIQLYAQVKKDGTTVTLDGHGSDELFGGYPNDINPKLYDDHPNLFRMIETYQTIENVKNNQDKSFLEVLAKDYKQITKAKFVHLYKPSFLKKKYPAFDYLNNQLIDSSFHTILPTLLRNYDRYSMINGVEIRMPFLDYRLVAFAFSIPGSSKVRKGYTKAIVRDAMKGFFPDEIRLLKRKIGFNSPSTEWLKGPLKEWVQDEMNSTSFKNAILINPKQVNAIFDRLLTNDSATFLDGENAWSALMPYVWEKAFTYFNK